MNNLNKIAGALLALGISSVACAIPITGSVDINGQVVLVGGDGSLGTATGAAATIGTVVNGTGSFLGTTASGVGAVSYAAFNWNPSSAPVSNLWSFGFGGRTYSFDLDTITFVSQTNNDLDVHGSGSL